MNTEFRISPTKGVVILPYHESVVNLIISLLSLSTVIVKQSYSIT
jgi:hypothetical protein